MKYFKTLKTWKGSNVTFNQETIEAYSHGHWCFVKLIKGKLIFNNFPYSISTQGHQRKVRSLLKELCIKIDFEVETDASLIHFSWEPKAKLYAKNQIEGLEKLESRGKAGSWASQNRLSNIKRYKEMIRNIENLMS